MNLVDDVENTVEGEVENTEPKEQEQAKTYSQEEVDAIRKQINEDNQKAWDKRWAKEHARIEQQDAKTKELLALQMEQTGSKNVEELLTKTYEAYGIDKPKYSKDDTKTLGMSDAQRIKEMDIADVEEEVNRLARSNRTEREEVTYRELDNFLKKEQLNAKRKQELEEIGADEEVTKSDEFKDFANKFKDSIPFKEIYEMYSKEHPKKEPYKAGSAKGEKSSNVVKDYYTYEESLQFTRKDFDENPALFKAIENSMTKWGKKEGV